MADINIMVGTPANGGTVTLSYMQSILNLQKSLFERGDAINVMHTQSMFLPKARNILATLFFEQNDYSHLLFVDSDMGFSPNLIRRMIEFDKPVVGVIYPHRSINFKNVAAAAKKTTDPDRLENLSATFTTENIVRNAQGFIEVKRGFVQVGHLGTGILLISRDAINEIALIPNIIAEDPAGLTATKKIIQCFMPLVNSTGLMLGEDISFCVRWKNAGGLMWACVDESITHTGLQNVRGRYIDRLVEDNPSSTNKS